MAETKTKTKNKKNVREKIKNRKRKSLKTVKWVDSLSSKNHQKKFFFVPVYLRCILLLSYVGPPYCLFPNLIGQTKTTDEQKNQDKPNKVKVSKPIKDHTLASSLYLIKKLV